MIILQPIDLQQVPNHRRRNGKTQYGSPGPWVHVHIRINLFTFEEWPLQDPASFKDLSIGEEQSSSTVTNVSWSEPGLAKHCRSVLTVLTSNLVLSLWESVSDPGEASSWRRVLVVNNALWEYFTTSGASEGAIRKGKRIRAAAWAHGSKISSRQEYGHILAVTNDCREVILLRIRGPYDAHNRCDQKLQVEILLCLGDLSESRLQSDPTVEFHDSAHQAPPNSGRRERSILKRVAGSVQQLNQDIIWSPLEDVNGTIQTMITHRNNGLLQHYLLQYNREGHRLEKLEHHDEPFSDGPIIWIGVSDHGHTLAMVPTLTVYRVMAMGMFLYVVHVTPLR